MGAYSFQTSAFGKDAAEAFKEARDFALWESGHGGYTGTIAEKHDFAGPFVPPVRGMTASKYATIVQEAAYYVNSGDGYSDDEKKQAKKFWAKHKRYADTLRKHAEIFDDKWGSAVCIVETLKETRERKKAAGLSRTRKKLFVFCGMASS